MTYIEFFDKTLIENICASLTTPPERVILIGDKKKLLESQAERYTEILLKRGFEVDFKYKSVNKNNLQNVLDILSEIVETYDDCVFDLTGGEDMYLVATGIIFERYKDKNIQMHRFNLRNNTIQDCDFDGHTIMESALPELTVEENIQVYGGDIVYDDIKPDTTPIWDFEGDFADDVDVMWDVCKENVRLWNTQIGVFAEAEQLRDSDSDELTTTVSISSLKEHLERMGVKYVFIRRIINGLYNAGLISAQEDEYTFSITYKNEQVKKCLTKAGQVLEMKIFVSALRTCEKDGSYTYNDVMNGVYIDWDGDIHTEQEGHDTENEIDVMMMHGMVPVFVSCKNGYIDMDELYKLNTVKEHNYTNGTLTTIAEFFGKYAVDAVGSIDFSGKSRTVDRITELIMQMRDYYETEHYIFVHGWLPNRSGSIHNEWKNASDADWKTARFTKWTEVYSGEGPVKEKTIVCGHLPTFFAKRFDEQRGDMEASPFYGKGIIAIDGGTDVTGKVNIIVLDDEIL